MPKHPQGKSEVEPPDFMIHCRPHFFELQPRYEVMIINNDTGEVLHHQTLNTNLTPFPNALKAYLHTHGYRRTNSFTRVNADGLTFAAAEFKGVPVLTDAEVERLGVL